jgi:hypothetical protein
LLGGQCHLTKRWRNGLVNPSRLSVRWLAPKADKSRRREIARDRLDFRLDKPYICRLFV